MINCHLYANLKSGKLLASQCARTDAGFWMDVEPITHADLNDKETIRKSLYALQTIEVITIPTPPRDNYPKPAILPHAGVRTGSELERRYCQFFIWTLVQDMSARIEGWKPIPGQRGMEPDLDRIQILHSGWTVEELANKIVVMIRALEEDPDGLPLRP
jgi:hypothetical protein